MNYMIHVTENCNLMCKYCYEENKQNIDIPFKYIKDIIDNEVKSKKDFCSITFYGGEPLLKKEIIRATIEYVKSKKSTKRFYYGITTNGTLLDEDFLQYMKENNFINIAYSIDGVEMAHNLNRITTDGEGSYDIVLKNARKLLSYFNDSIAMCVVTKNNLKYLGESIKHLVNIGFYYINILFDYTEDWQDNDLVEIKKQYSNVAQIYINKMLNEEPIYMPIFDEKIKSYVQSEYNCNDNCMLGIKSVNVGTDGNFYPCMQFVKNSNFIIGNTRDGIDYEARSRLLESSGRELDLCKNCNIKKRCKHICACKNYLINKNVNELSPLVCETERIIIKIADKIAEDLYTRKSKMFMKKFYNK